MKALKQAGIFFIFCALLVGCKTEPKKKEAPAQDTTIASSAPAPAMIDYSVVATLPHDTTSFTEGLLFHNGQLFESTGTPAGSNFRSVFGPVDLKTGKIEVKAEIDGKTYFGEGIAFLKNKVYQVTYQTHVGFIYDAKTFRKIGQFNYSNEGWGMTTDGTYIIMSNGTENLTYFDEGFKPVKTLSVKESGYAQESLNELEYINGYIYANIWMTGYIVKIDPATGNVVGKLNLTPVSYDVKNMHSSAMEMNGIAYNAATDKIYITGKTWPYLYELKFAH